MKRPGNQTVAFEVAAGRRVFDLEVRGCVVEPGRITAPALGPLRGTVRTAVVDGVRCRITDAAIGSQIIEFIYTGGARSERADQIERA